MIIVCKFATFTCCGKCCDGTNIFGHASLLCTNEGFGLSGGYPNPHLQGREAFFDVQRKHFKKVEEYVCIPTLEDGGRLNAIGGEQVQLFPKVPMSEVALSKWWQGLNRNAGSRDCADLVTDALRAAGAKNTSCWARRLSSLFVLTPNSCIAFAEALALDMCNTGRISSEDYADLLKDAGGIEGVNKFKGPGGSCWCF